MPTVEKVAVATDAITGCFDFAVCTTDGLGTGFTVAETMCDAFVERLLATCCDNGAVLGPSDVSAPTDPLVFRCPEKIIASFLRAS
ncbi:MAG TPA: hypothetical protein DDZ51_06805 [Planctomycetaceae bacterium]|nr:hypothetical protein [Planctomycetaceae bacterium]